MRVVTCPQRTNRGSPTDWLAECSLRAKEKRCPSTTPADCRIARLYFTARPLALIAYHFPPNCLVPTLEVSPGLVVAMSMYSGWPA